MLVVALMINPRGGGGILEAKSEGGSERRLRTSREWGHWGVKWVRVYVYVYHNFVCICAFSRCVCIERKKKEKKENERKERKKGT